MSFRIFICVLLVAFSSTHVAFADIPSPLSTVSGYINFTADISAGHYINWQTAENGDLELLVVPVDDEGNVIDVAIFDEQGNKKSQDPSANGQPLGDYLGSSVGAGFSDGGSGNGPGGAYCLGINCYEEQSGTFGDGGL